MSRRVFIETYGCQMNIADSELMQGILSNDGYEQADGLEDADVILLNTCAVREKAEVRIFRRLSNLEHLKRKKPSLKIGVVGCMAEHLRKNIQEQAPFVDLVIGPDAYRRLPALIEESEFDPVIDVRLDRHEVYEGLNPIRAEGPSGWVTIQRGCDKFCTFCIVPFVRGRERGIPPREVLRQVRALVEKGISTVTLLGQTVNSYKYEGIDFSDLLRAVAGIEGIEWIRFTSPYPIDFTPKLIETIATEPKVCKFVHLPLQSGSDKMLSAMSRKHTVEEYRQLVHDLRAAIPNLTLSTDVMMGFPGEEEEDYLDTLNFMAEVRYDSAFMFAYSEREGTFASKKLPDTVSEKDKKRRLAAIIKQQNEISHEIYQTNIGKSLIVMAEGYTKRNPNDLIGKSDGFKTVIFPDEGTYRPGDFVEVEIYTATSRTLVGKALRLVNPSRLPIDLRASLSGPGMSIGAAPKKKK